MEQTINRHYKLPPELKEECEKLLRAAIGHWKALKTTSPAGLREGFLQREGKLILQGYQDRLLVEYKLHDVLLSWLPWGIGIIKLPWLPRELYVDWND